MIENSYCVMITAWDHGMEMFTNKIPEDNVLKIANEMAAEGSLPLMDMEIESVFETMIKTESCTPRELSATAVACFPEKNQRRRATRCTLHSENRHASLRFR